MELQTLPMVRDDQASGELPTIVVGTDGSWHCETATAWAAKQARVRGARIVLVYVGDRTPHHAGEDPTSAMWGVVRTLSTSGVNTSGVVATGLPETELVRRSKSADLLVLSSESGAYVRRLSYLLTYCLTHADCPVVVVPSSQPREENGP